MTREEFLQIFPLATDDTLRANGFECAGASTVVEPDPRNERVATGAVQETRSGRFLVRVTSVRKRLIDEDNLCEKYHVDCLRYAGLIPGDDPAQARIETSQRKCRKGDPEQIEIVIERCV